LQSHVGVRHDLFGRDYSKTLITDFFGNVPSVEVTFGKTDVDGLEKDITISGFKRKIVRQKKPKDDGILSFLKSLMRQVSLMTKPQDTWSSIQQGHKLS
jgi:glycosylphosphatidylinositol transamidase (GPIT) subunit GPI8